jgi:hypothetical protein
MKALTLRRCWRQDRRLLEQSDIEEWTVFCGFSYATLRCAFAFSSDCLYVSWSPPCGLSHGSSRGRLRRDDTQVIGSRSIIRRSRLCAVGQVPSSLRSRETRILASPRCILERVGQLRRRCWIVIRGNSYRRRSPRPGRSRIRSRWVCRYGGAWRRGGSLLRGGRKRKSQRGN